MTQEKRTLMAQSRSGMKVYAVENFDLSEPPDHEVFDKPEFKRRWHQIFKVAVTLMGMSEYEAYAHASGTVFGALKDV